MISKDKIKQNKINGITLISLVITIILLIILAGIGINLSIGENGLFNKAKQAKEKYNETKAKEKLEVVLAEALVEKETNTSYNSEYFLDNLLTSEDMSVNLSTVTVNNYNFLIDREKLIVLENLGESNIKIESEIKEYLGKDGNNKYRVNALMTIQSNIEIESIKIINPDETIIELAVNNKEILKDITIELDQKYKIEVKTKNGKTHTRFFIEKSEEKIRNLEEFLEFRDKVNSGLTYEGKTLQLVTDLDLSSICGKEKGSFEPIGNGEWFMGIFEGNNHSIKNIFINELANYNGLFGFIDSSEIRNLVLDEGNINNGTNTGGICGYASNSTIFNCINNVEINGTTRMAGGITAEANSSTIEQCSNLKPITGTHSIGGMSGFLIDSTVINSYNIGNIITRDSGGGYSQYVAGGIVGQISKKSGNTTILNCYNIGEIYGKTHTGGIAGFAYQGNNHIINNCYSVGNITGGNKYAIAGTGSFSLDNNYWLESCGVSSGSSRGNTNAEPKSESEIKALVSTLGEEYIKDGKKIDKDGNIVDSKDDKGNIIYINNGYPILKWQIRQ